MLNPARASPLFAALLPPGIASAQMDGAADFDGLLDQERCLPIRATPQRRREFAAGRLCARYAAAQLGVDGVAIGRLDDGRARWPPDLTGSITHSDGFCAAAVGRLQQWRAIGIDAESISGMSEDICKQILLPAERDWLAAQAISEQARCATLLFSAKEAFYKCQYPVTRQWLEFSDIALRLSAGTLDAGSFSVQPIGRVQLFVADQRPVIVHFSTSHERVLSTMTIAA